MSISSVLPAKSQEEEKATAAEIERLQGLLEGRPQTNPPDIDALLADKDRQLHDVIADYEEKLTVSNDALKQRETELLAQVRLCVYCCLTKTSYRILNSDKNIANYYYCIIILILGDQNQCDTK
mgnify:CR=1 FL=1